MANKPFIVDDDETPPVPEDANIIIPETQFSPPNVARTPGGQPAPPLPNQMGLLSDSDDDDDDDDLNDENTDPDLLPRGQEDVDRGIRGSGDWNSAYHWKTVEVKAAMRAGHYTSSYEQTQSRPELEVKSANAYGPFLKEYYAGGKYSKYHKHDSVLDPPLERSISYRSSGKAVWERYKKVQAEGRNGILPHVHKHLHGGKPPSGKTILEVLMGPVKDAYYDSVHEGKNSEGEKHKAAWTNAMFEVYLEFGIAGEDFTEFQSSAGGDDGLKSRKQQRSQKQEDAREAARLRVGGLGTTQPASSFDTYALAQGRTAAASVLQTEVNARNARTEELKLLLTVYDPGTPDYVAARAQLVEHVRSDPPGYRSPSRVRSDDE